MTLDNRTPPLNASGLDKSGWLTLLRQHRAIAIVRSPDLSTGMAMAWAAIAGGFRLLEVTWNSDRPAELVRQLRRELPPDCWVGVGTVLTLEAGQAAIAAGAQFCFSPHTVRPLLHWGERHRVPIIPGALTPTEIHQAWQLGGWGVKVFPCQAIGGAAYVRQLQAPFGHIPLIPTGGVSVDTAAAYLTAGAIAVGVGSALFTPHLIARKDWAAITASSQQLLRSLPPSPAIGDCPEVLPCTPSS